jgi:hypothetical protein
MHQLVCLTRVFHAFKRVLLLSHLQESTATAAADSSQLGSFGRLESVVHPRGSAGAALMQSCAVQIDSCTYDRNTAEQSAGALLVRQPSQLLLVNSSLTNNSAAQGVGGAMVVTGLVTGRAAAAVVYKLTALEPAPPAAAAAEVRMQDCSFISNAASAGSGGAAVFDSQLGGLTVSCKTCKFAGNSGGGDGGGIAAYGQTEFDCADCSANDNTAGRSGGWMFCSGCSSVSLTRGDNTNNSAAAEGGAVACQGCSAFAANEASYSSNAAASGGAVAIQFAADVTLQSCEFNENNAEQQGSDSIRWNAITSNSSDAAVVPARLLQLQVANSLPLQWQLLYGVGAAAAAAKMDCSTVGSGGAVCVSSAAAARLDDCEWHDNRASTGGAVFASEAAACSASTGSLTADSNSSSSSSSSECLVKMTVTSATGNSADQAGGVLYTSTPGAIQLHSSSSSSSSSSSGDVSGSFQAPWSLLQQLQRDNTVGVGGYGAGAASFPAQLSLVRPEQPEQQQQEEEGTTQVTQLGRRSRRLLQQQQQHQQQESASRMLAQVGSAPTMAVDRMAPATADDASAAGESKHRELLHCNGQNQQRQPIPNTTPSAKAGCRCIDSDSYATLFGAACAACCLPVLILTPRAATQVACCSSGSGQQ